MTSHPRPWPGYLWFTLGFCLGTSVIDLARWHIDELGWLGVSEVFTVCLLRWLYVRDRTYHGTRATVRIEISL